MKIKILNIIFIGILGIGFSGCLNKDEITCNEETVQSTVKEIIEPTIQSKIFVSKVNNGDYKDFQGMETNTFNILLSQVGGSMEALLKHPIFTNGLLSSNKEVGGLTRKILTTFLSFESEFKTHSVELNDFLTTKKEKELSRVECASEVKIDFDNQIYNFNIEYTAQLTDDKKEVYVEVTSIE